MDRKIHFPVNKDYILEFDSNNRKIDLLEWQEFENVRLINSEEEEVAEIPFARSDDISVVVIPSHFCNLSCKYCHDGTMTSSIQKLEKNMIDSIFDFLEQFEENKVVKWTLMGGEPFHHVVEESVLCLMERIKERGEPIHAICNGTLLNEVYANYLDSVQIALDGTREFHDYRRLYPDGKGSFQDTVNGIETALACDTSVSVRVHVDAHNINNVPELLHYLSSKGYLSKKHFEVYMYPLSESGSFDYQYFTDELSLVKRAVYLMREYPHLRKTKWRFQGIELFENIREGKEFPTADFHFCCAHSNQIVFDPQGDVYVCWVGLEKEHFKIGKYCPEKRLYKGLFKRWRDRNMINLEECCSCYFQPVCGGDCSHKAYKETKKSGDPRCVPVLEILEEWVPLLLDNFEMVERTSFERWDFEKWADNYDASVKSKGWLHSDYEKILREVSNRATGSFLVDIGAGTGNILQYLREGIRYVGIEPSPNMRRVFREKHRDKEVYSGHFLYVPLMSRIADTVLSSYAFHHVRDEDKERSIEEMLRLLKNGGKLVIGDIMFQSEDEKARIGEEDNILEDVNDEYFASIDHMKNILDTLQMKSVFTQINRYIWIMEVFT
ncbi:MAG: methyltransferase domain-containing protein [Theionarchaea archaeon]|nr:methyltransferase domain-containing protein [Theionarchaea archaeon]MBU7020615.1 methyltransferase domain-containing protein [Theionarchaea archaeon]MBU7034264.1 methyltransferase domain-containing protein [Theionarchaea archaeon]MBU7039338.1 methyltransferase domain-containing protein [Theionarchaea archaeon]